LNAAIRGRLVAAGDVDDTAVATTRAGQRIGAGDLVVTRQDDRDVDVANRDTWTVTAVHDDSALALTPIRGSGLTGSRSVPAGYVNRHVELGSAATVYAVQGATTQTGHLVLDQHTAAAAYVGMTRGRRANTVHVIAADLADARAQWIDAAGHGRTDLGVGAARAQAERAAAPYAAGSAPDQAGGKS